ncbi:MAG: shikimate dehydrogenase [Corynebacterium sp.]|nr:shikimate dehydrogenase [Corynebacterium sp.]
MITHRAAVLGKPIDHSLSPLLHNAGYAAIGLAHWYYDRFSCTAEELPELVSNADESYRGFSVTMPGKFAALEFAQEATMRAQKIGSANTLVRIGDQYWRADNTDCDGIRGALQELDALRGRRAVVIGGGGTARPALWALAEAGYSAITVLNRSDKTAELSPLVPHVEFDLQPLDQSHLEVVEQADVVISTVPSVAIQGFEDVLARVPVLDVIYNPWPTPLVLMAQQCNVPAVGGHVMLAHQAFGQFEQFTGLSAPRVAMMEALKAAVE